MLKERSILLIILLLIIVYFSQGVFYATGSIISQLCLFSFLALSGIYLIKLLLSRKEKELFFKAWTALLLINILGFIFTGYISNPSHFGMFKGILISSLPFYPIYYFSKKNILSSKHLIVFFVVMLVISILQFYFNRDIILLERISGNENIVNNAAYMFVNLIPFVFLIKNNRLISMASMLLIIFFIIQGSKRGAILVGAFGAIMYVYYLLRTVDKKKRLRGYLLVSVLIGVIAYFVYNFYLENEFLRNRMLLLSEGGASVSSGRDVIYSRIFNSWYYSDNLINLLFGFGFAGSQYLTRGAFAHNDWLELLSNFGLLGVVIYLWLFFAAYKLIRNGNWNSDKKYIFFTVVAMWFLVTLFSMGYTSSAGYMRAMILAYLIGSRESN